MAGGRAATSSGSLRSLPMALMLEMAGTGC